MKTLIEEVEEFIVIMSPLLLIMITIGVIIYLL
jgi:hypothetical protein